MPIKTSLFLFATALFWQAPVFAQAISPSSTADNKNELPAQASPRANKLIWQPIPELNGKEEETSKREKPSIMLQPKFKKRILDLKDQIDLALSKGFISAETAATFKQRQSILNLQEEDAGKAGSPSSLRDELEKSITVLNQDLFRAMNKDKSTSDNSGSVPETQTIDSSKSNLSKNADTAGTTTSSSQNADTGSGSKTKTELDSLQSK